MMIHKITPTFDYNQWLKRFDTQLNEPTNQIQCKSPRLSYRIRKRYYKTMGNFYQREKKFQKNKIKVFLSDKKQIFYNANIFVTSTKVPYPPSLKGQPMISLTVCFHRIKGLRMRKHNMWIYLHITLPFKRDGTIIIFLMKGWNTGIEN